MRTRFKKSFKECEINREIVCCNMVYKTLFRAVSCQKNYSWKRCKCSIGLPSRFFFLFISFRRRSRKCRSLDSLPKEIRRLATQEKWMNVQKEFWAAEGVNAPQVDFSFTRRGKLKQFRFVRLMFKKNFKEPIAKI